MNTAQPIAMYVPEAIDIAEARAIVLRQIDRLADWIAAMCLGATQVKARPALYDRTAEDFKDWPVSSLVYLSMDMGQPQSTRCAASEAIGERFLADDDVQAEVVAVANRLMLQRWYAERQDRHEQREELAHVLDMPALALVGSDE